MTQADAAQPDASPTLPFETVAAARQRSLPKELIWLAAPVLAENVLHMGVGWSDTFLAGRLPAHAADATAAIGLVTYVIWLIGLLAGAIGTGSTAIIARAVGARHQRLANSVCGQSVSAAFVGGLAITLASLASATPIARAMGLDPASRAMEYSVFYLRVLGLSLPFLMLMLAANSCLRGAGDSLTPAVAMIVVDVVNIISSFALTRGWFGLPVMGFRGIAIGTVIAYIAGGVLQFAVLLSGRGKIRLFAHRLWPNWLTLKRILRIGIPSGMEGLLTWIAQIIILRIIFRIDPTNVLSSAHLITIRVESLSFMTGLAFATAAATVVGQSLGMHDPRRARRAANLAYAMGGGLMSVGGICFILFGHPLAQCLSQDPRIVNLSVLCLFITAFSQPGFAATLIFGGALRGAGDTRVVMYINLASIVGLRLVGVLIAILLLHGSLPAVWIVLAAELSLRGGFIYARFRQGGWVLARV